MIRTKKRSLNPFSPEFAKYFQGALWGYFALATLVTIMNNIHW